MVRSYLCIRRWKVGRYSSYTAVELNSEFNFGFDSNRVMRWCGY